MKEKHELHEQVRLHLERKRCIRTAYKISRYMKGRQPTVKPKKQAVCCLGFTKNKV
jgi:hypothetical protein